MTLFCSVMLDGACEDCHDQQTPIEVVQLLANSSDLGIVMYDF